MPARGAAEVSALGALARAVALAVVVSGCAPGPARAPVSERAAAEARLPPAPGRAAPAEADWRPRSYTVKKGDTLYSIALEHGVEYRELAAWNNIENPSRIRIGQQLRLSPPEETVVLAPARPAAGMEVRPLDAPPAPPARGPRGEGPKSSPKALKLPYSEQNLALVLGGSAAPPAPAPPAPVPPAAEPARAEAPPQAPAPAAAEESAGEEAPAFTWPTQGKVIASFSEASKGVDIAGRAGQPIFASAAGKVVYSGSGLRGYGKLIIIKHNRIYLSAYAHNDQLLVKEGQTVTKGQKIAEMGSTDSDRVKLHFEIRRFGKPVDPLKHLPELS
jgi:lipoprotein NlpD